MKASATKQPKKTRGFSWGRALGEEGVMVWRLYRWDSCGRMHYERLALHQRSRRAWMAQEILQARHRLRDKVDDIDLKAFGLT